jgi:UDP-N-acetylmuramate dehydrogenase
MEASGYRLGQPLAHGVRMSTRQFTLVAGEGATTTAFVEAARQVQDRVLERTGVRMPAELDPVGSLPEYTRLLDRRAPEVAMSSR